MRCGVLAGQIFPAGRFQHAALLCSARSARRGRCAPTGPRRGLVCVLGCGRPSLPVLLRRTQPGRGFFVFILLGRSVVFFLLRIFHRFGKQALFLRARFFCPSATFAQALAPQSVSLQSLAASSADSPPPPAAWPPLSLMLLTSGAAVLRSGRNRPFGSSGLVPPVPNLLTGGGSPWVPTTRPAPLASSCFSGWGRVSPGR